MSLGRLRPFAGSLTKHKAAWIKEGMVARVQHLRGEEKLRHATIQAIRPHGELPFEAAPDVGPDRA